MSFLGTCWTATTGLSMYNVFLGQDFQARHMLMALEAGEISRVVRALIVLLCLRTRLLMSNTVKKFTEELRSCL